MTMGQSVDRMIGKGHRSTRRKPAPVLLLHDLIRARTRAAAEGSRRLTAYACVGQDGTVPESHCAKEASSCHGLGRDVDPRLSQQTMESGSPL
jgi:hypothetical protein